MPKVSIITPIYNHGFLLDRSGSSVMAQTFKDFEWIMLNDGSTDNTAEHIKRWEKICDKLVVTHIPKRVPFEDALNMTIKLATGDFISGLQADDALEPTFLEDLYEVAKDVDFAYSLYYGHKYYGRNLKLNLNPIGRAFKPGPFGFGSLPISYMARREKCWKYLMQDSGVTCADEGCCSWIQFLIDDTIRFGFVKKPLYKHIRDYPINKHTGDQSQEAGRNHFLSKWRAKHFNKAKKRFLELKAMYDK
jgi:glycosyltransferase involved in cell wall biosynthesis